MGGIRDAARRRAPWALTTAVTLLVLPALADEEPAPATKASPAGAEKPKTVRPKKAAAKKPPQTVKLPPAGEHEAETLLALAGVLTGKTVRIESERARRVKVEISEALGGVDVTLTELTILLAAHRLYLFPITDPKEGNLLVVSRNPTWSAEPEVFTMVLDVPAGAFDLVVKRIEKAVEDKNASLPKDLPPFVAVSSPRVGKVFLRGPRESDLAAIAKVAEAGEEDARAEDARRPRLYTYQGRFRKVENLEEELLAKLEEGELNVLRTVVSSRGNRLLYRCPPALAEKVKGLLEKLDKGKEAPPEPAPRRSPGPPGR